jgi:hypothetical protein
MKLRFPLLLVAILFSFKTFAQQGFPFDNEIRDFKHQDSLHFPKPNGILFIGSSSIRLWDDLEKRFSKEPIIKRGVGGCELSQLVKYYTPYILFPYKPRKVFIYAGENDIAGGKPADSVVKDFKQLWSMIRTKLPKADIYFLSVKPSPSRAKYFGVMQSANKQIKSFLVNKPKSLYVDVSTVILKPQTGQPDSSLFKGDYLHLNSKGYDRWQKVLTPYVK